MKRGAKLLVVVAVLAGCGKAPGPEDGGGGAAGGGAAGGSAAGGGVGGGTGGGSGGGEADAGQGDGGTPDCSVHALRDVSIPMRDGKSLAAFIRVPTDARCKLPVVVIQTPYGKDSAKLVWFSGTGADPLFDSKDYAFVVVDWRGFFGSAAAKVPGAQPFSEDGFDTVEWAGTQSFSNGKVGTWGVSALCVQQFRTAILKPPHLAAAVPIFCSMNTTYEQYYPGGVLRLEYYNFIGFYFGGGIILGNPYRNATWQFAEKLLKPADITVPMLVVAGWYDLYPGGSLGTWSELKSSPAAAQHRLLIGAWIHQAMGGETAGGRALNPQELLYIDSAKKVQSDSRDFFDLHLRGLTTSAASSWSSVRYVRGGEGTWESAADWPPTGPLPRTFYLSGDGGLAAAAPASGTVTFPYVPLDPSPTLGGATLSAALLHGPTVQGPVTSRSDARSFAGPLLTQPLRIRGALTLSLDVATNRLDTDFAARLTDVQPDGGHLLLAEGIRRLKLRSSLSTVSGVDAGVRYTVPVNFTSDLAYTFAVGHRVGLIITSSNFPRFDRNPNTGADFLPDAGFPAFDATNTLFLDGASRLVLPADP
ncbi:MAG: hypothetical protein H6Q89_3389 [Myxococcaceae bacterium]|nr:hypothetical protein [Myxococcaceae bacterium]